MRPLYLRILLHYPAKQTGERGRGERTSSASHFTLSTVEDEQGGKGRKRRRIKIIDFLSSSIHPSTLDAGAWRGRRGGGKGEEKRKDPVLRRSAVRVRTEERRGGGEERREKKRGLHGIDAGLLNHSSGSLNLARRGASCGRRGEGERKGGEKRKGGKKAPPLVFSTLCRWAGTYGEEEKEKGKKEEERGWSCFRAERREGVGEEKRKKGRKKTHREPLVSGRASNKRTCGGREQKEEGKEGKGN